MIKSGAPAWEYACEVLKSLRVEIEVIEPLPDLPDMPVAGDCGMHAPGMQPGTPLARGQGKPLVQGARCVREDGGVVRARSCSHALSLTWLSGMVPGNRFIASNFRYAGRMGEVAPYVDWLAKHGFMIYTLPAGVIFEGPGDIIYRGNATNASILGGLGSLTCTAASLFMDAFAARRTGPRRCRGRAIRTSMDQFAMLPRENVHAFEAVLSVPEASQVVVSSGDPRARLNVWIRPGALATGARTFTAHARPGMATACAPPTSELEQMVATAWQELAGIEQIEIDDNFFELGGNALIGLREIPVVTLFEGPTIMPSRRSLARDNRWLRMKRAGTGEPGAENACSKSRETVNDALRQPGLQSSRAVPG